MSVATTETRESSGERVPPHDQAAEQAVIGGMLLSKDALGDAAEILVAGDFYRPAHAAIFETITRLFGQGEPADAVTVADALNRAGQLTKIGGAAYLHTCLAEVPTAASTAYYARIVASTATRRQVIDAATRVVQLGYRGDGDGADLLDQAQQTFYDLGQGVDQSRLVQFGELMQPTLDEIEAVGAAGGALRGVPTGFADLDRLLNGLRPSQLILVAGRPAMGKSVAATGFATNAALKHNMAAAIFNLEMSSTELMMRILSAEARVPLHVLNSGHLADSDWTKLARRMAEISKAPLFIDDSASLNLMEIRAKARRLKQRHDLKLIVVDYLQLMTSPRRTESRQQEVADLSRGLKLLAKEIECPVVAVSQLKRDVDGRTDKRPGLSDLRESGSLEQDADVVLFVHRDDYYDKDSPRAGEADFIVAKHRSGPTDTVTVAHQLHFSRFVDMAI